MEEERKNTEKEFRAMCIIVKRNKGDIIASALKEMNINTGCIFLGRGTAKSELLNLFGLGDSEKDILVTAMPLSKAEKVLELLQTKFKFGEPGKGLAFTVKLNSLGSMAVYNLLINNFGGKF